MTAASHSVLNTWLLGIIATGLMGFGGFGLTAIYSINGSVTAQVEINKKNDERTAEIKTSITDLDKKVDCKADALAMGQEQIKVALGELKGAKSRP